MNKNVFDANDFVSQWVEYWNHRDINSVQDLYDDDFEFYSPFLKKSEKFPDGTITNKQSLKSYFDKIVTQIPNLKLMLKDVRTAANTVNFTYVSSPENLVANASLEFGDNGKIKKSYFNFRPDQLFADRVHRIPKSFIREILKVTAEPEIISFAGGLPNPEFFPVEELKEATRKVLEEDGSEVLQYTVSEGYGPLRESIADRYWVKHKLKVDPDQILITNGSQQSLDLAGKIFINNSDRVLLEKPSYLGAIQAFSIYEPSFTHVNLDEDGVDTGQLESLIQKNRFKLFYVVPNFQNPTGISYSAEKRKRVGEIMSETNTWLVEDDPYGEIRFIGKDLPPISKYLNGKSIMAGSFSKIVAPGLRMGWVVAPEEVTEQMIVMKQGTDLHSNFLSQRIIHRFLLDNDLDQHIQKIKDAYRVQRNLMVEMIKTYFPEEVRFTQPEGGMFLWVTLPKYLKSIELFRLALENKVAFVPGNPFYTNGGGNDTFRLNYSNCNHEKIEEGIKRLGLLLQSCIVKR